MSEKYEIKNATELAGSPSLSRVGSATEEDLKTGKVLQINPDDEQLYSMGYEQHMRRGFTGWSMTAFCLTGLGLLPSLGGTIWYSLGYLGLMPMTWAWLAASFFIMSMVLSLAEMSSSMPTAGGLCALVMILPSKILGRISTVFAWMGTLTFFVVLIAVPVYAHRNGVYNSTHDMFFARYNQTGFRNDGLVFLLTFLVPCWCISGYDSTAHLAEETENATVVVPRAMWTSCLLVTVLGYIFNAALAYAAVDVDGILGSPLGQPLAAIMQSAMGDGAFPKLLWICTVLSNFGIVFVMNTSGTRIFWAYARDGALPFSKFLSTVNATTRTPMNATLVLSVVFALIGLISLGSSAALQAFFSGSSVTGAAAYLMPVLMRCLYEDNPEYVPGPYTLGRLSRPIRWVATLWTLFTLPILAFPSTAHPNADTFNWSVVFYVGMFVIVLPWYFLRARHWFKGPGESIAS